MFAKFQHVLGTKQFGCLACLTCHCLAGSRISQLSSPNLYGQGRKYGYVCYKDFVKAMEGHPPPRGGGGRNGSAGERRKGGKSERRRRRRSSASNIERLVDRLKEVSSYIAHEVAFVVKYVVADVRQRVGLHIAAQTKALLYTMYSMYQERKK